MGKNWTSNVTCIYHYFHCHYSCCIKDNFSDKYKPRITIRKQKHMFVFNLRFLHISASSIIALRCVNTFKICCRLGSLSVSICWTFLWFTFLHTAMSPWKSIISSLFTPYWFWKSWHSNNPRFYIVHKGWIIIDTICKTKMLFCNHFIYWHAVLPVVEGSSLPCDVFFTIHSVKSF